MPRPDPGLDEPTRAKLHRLREAVVAQHKLHIDYGDENSRRSQRRVRPLGCFFWGQVWTLAAWCELRQDFRSFRIDRIAVLQVLDERCPPEPGRTLADFLRAVRADERPDNGPR
jgi:predicted DNA-binding transcriptional regulator YafY